MIVGSIFVAVILGIAWTSLRTAPVRGSLGTLSRIIVAADQEDDETLRLLCTQRYLHEGGLRRAAEGGLIGFPRTIDRNFQAWTESESVLICPTGRTGPVYRFIEEGNRWRFDGIAGVLGRGGGSIE